MTTQILIPRALDANGDPVSGAEARFYQTGTTTPVTVYSDTGLTSALTVPLEADSGGVFRQVFYDGATAIRLKVTETGEGAEVFDTLDPAPTFSTTTGGAAAVSFTPTTAVPKTTVQDAIAYNGDQRYNRSANVKTMLASANNSEIRSNIGLGYYANTSTLITDWDDATSSGPVHCASSSSNAPSTESLRGHVINNGLSGLTQIAYDGDDKVYLRVGAGNSWNLVGSAHYQSAEQTITSAGSLTLAHGLGSAPLKLWLVLKCQTAEQGYSVGDHVAMTTNRQATNAGVSIVPDATNLNVRYGSNGDVFIGNHKTTGAGVNLTNANWTAIFIASL